MANHLFDEYDNLDSIEVLNTDQSIRQIRQSVPNGSLMAGYLDDFLPGERNQWLTAKLRPVPNGWHLAIRVPIMDGVGDHYFTKTGQPLR